MPLSNQFTTPILAAAAVTLAATTAAHAERVFFADLDPLNGSGVTGRATLTLDDDTNQLTVQIDATGLVPDSLHPQHIHGRFAPGPGDGMTAPRRHAHRLRYPAPPPPIPTATGSSPSPRGCPSMARSFLTSFRTPPADVPADFPTAPGGTLSFRETYDLDTTDLLFFPMTGTQYEADDLTPLDFREIVLHGGFVPVGVQGTTAADDPDGDGIAYSAMIPVARGVSLSCPPPPPPSPGWRCWVAWPFAAAVWPDPRRDHGHGRPACVSTIKSPPSRPASSRGGSFLCAGRLARVSEIHPQPDADRVGLPIVEGLAEVARVERDAVGEQGR